MKYLVRISRMYSTAVGDISILCPIAKINNGGKQQVFSDLIPTTPQLLKQSLKRSLQLVVPLRPPELFIQMTSMLKNLITEKVYSVITWYQKTGNDQESQGNTINF